MEFSQDTSAGISSLMNMGLLNTLPPQHGNIDWTLPVETLEVDENVILMGQNYLGMMKFEVQEHISSSASGPEYAGRWSDFGGWHMARYDLVFMKNKGLATSNNFLKCIIDTRETRM